MAENPPDRRDNSVILGQLATDVAVIKERTTTTQTGLARVEGKLEKLDTRLDSALFRDEYERRHKEVEDKAMAALETARKADERAAAAEDRAEAASKDLKDAQSRFRWTVGTFFAAVGALSAIGYIFIALK